MSILDSIHEAEERAAKLRSDAKAEARETIRAAEVETREKGEDAIAEARKKAETNVKAAQEESAKQMDMAIADIRKENGVVADRARNSIPNAVSFILERVEST